MRRDPETTGIYIHFPYCIQKCHYCDFYSVGLDQVATDSATNSPGAGRGPTTVADEQLKSFYDSLERELAARLRVTHEREGFRRFSRINTVFFGGGTASLMTPDLIQEILKLLRGEFAFAENIEITLEGNPENFTADYLRSLHQLGVTRVNVGLQSFREDLLDDMNRYYDPGRYDAVLENLRDAAIQQIGGDLIYGFPGQSEAEFYADLNRTLAAGVNHLSIYSLTLESNTTYAGHVRTGKMIAPGEDLQERIFQDLPRVLAERGLRHYEISNFARPGYECRHNLRYWLYESYLGLGPGAHGFDGYSRYGNSRSVSNWQKAPASAAFEQHDPLEELPLVYLRLCDAIDANLFRDVLVGEGGFSERVADRARAVISGWVDAGYGESVATAPCGFRWKMNGLLQLDDRVLEMCAALEESAR